MIYDAYLLDLKTSGFARNFSSSRVLYSYPKLGDLMRKTPILLNLLAQYESQLTAREFQSFAEEVDRLLLQNFTHLGTFAPGIQRGREVQRLVDEQVLLSSNIKTTCQKGCGACCHLEVEITRDDAEILAESVLNGVRLDHERLRELSHRDRLDVLWKAGVSPMNRCVFLGHDQACRNYENRPSICRKHAVVSPVVECEKIGGQPVARTLPIAEIVISAAISFADNEFAALPKMLQKILNEKVGASGTQNIENSPSLSSSLEI